MKNKSLSVFILLSCCFIGLKAQAATYTLNSCNIYAGQTVMIPSTDTCIYS